MRKLLILIGLCLTLSLSGQLLPGIVASQGGAAADPSSPPSFLSSDGDTWGWYLYTDSVVQTGNAVRRWGDYLNSSNDLLVVSTRYPTLGATGITFDGSDDFLTTGEKTLGQPITIYAVIKQLAWEEYDRLIDGNLGASMLLQQITASPQMRVYGGGASTASGDASIDEWVIVTIQFNGASSSFQIDDADAITGDFGTATPSGLSLGAGPSAGSDYNSNYEISELIVRDAADDAGEIAAVKNYLNAKYEIY